MDTAIISDPDKNIARYRAAIADWLKQMTPEARPDLARYAVTLTFDLNRMAKSCWTGILDKSSALRLAKRDFAKFRWKLDRSVLKNAASRFGQELSYVPVIEGQGVGKQLHYHCVIVTPGRVALPEMIASVKHAWSSTAFGGFEIDVQHMRDDGWLNYMSKEAWKVDRDVVDVDNVRLGACPMRC